jgi:hypothetical protein
MSRETRRLNAIFLRFFLPSRQEGRDVNFIWALFSLFLQNAQSTQIVNEKFVHYFIGFSLYFLRDTWYTNHRRTTIYCVVTFLSLLNMEISGREEKEAKK